MAAMENDETNHTHAQLLKGHISSPKDPKWLADNVEDVYDNFIQILKLIEQDDEHFTENRTKLMAHVDGILHRHHFLAQQYNELQKTFPNDKSSASDTQKDGDSIMVGFPKDSCFESPDPKFVATRKMESGGPIFDSSQRSDDFGSEISGQGGSECSSLLFSDSDSESHKLSATKSLSSPFGAGMVCEDTLLNTHKEISVAEFSRQINEYEEELRLCRKRLQLSEEQVGKLRKELDEMTNLEFKSQLESAKCEIQVREDELEAERQKAQELQMQVSCLENQVIDSIGMVAVLEMELDASKEKIRSLEAEFANAKNGFSDENSDYACQLKNQLESVQRQVVSLETAVDSEKRRASEMQDAVQKYQSDISERDDDIRKLKAALQGATEKFSAGEAQLQALWQKLVLLEEKEEEWVSRSCSLEKDIQRCEADKAEMQRIHEIREIKWKNDLNHQEMELHEQHRLADLLNQGLDRVNLKHDVLMAKRDGAISKIQTLGAELDSRDNKIEQIQRSLRELHVENVELVLASESAHEECENLKLRVEELEKEVERQNAVISDRAEEKREAIRQLCFSLDHYRTIYDQLCRAYSARKHVGVASA